MWGINKNRVKSVQHYWVKKLDRYYSKCGMVGYTEPDRSDLKACKTCLKALKNESN